MERTNLPKEVPAESAEDRVARRLIALGSRVTLQNRECRPINRVHTRYIGMCRLAGLRTLFDVVQSADDHVDPGQRLKQDDLPNPDVEPATKS